MVDANDGKTRRGVVIKDPKKRPRVHSDMTERSRHASLNTVEDSSTVRVLVEGLRN